MKFEVAIFGNYSKEEMVKTANAVAPIFESVVERYFKNYKVDFVKKEKDGLYKVLLFSVDSNEEPANILGVLASFDEKAYAEISASDDFKLYIFVIGDKKVIGLEGLFYKSKLAYTEGNMSKWEKLHKSIEDILLSYGLD